MSKWIDKAEYTDIYVHGEEQKVFCYRSGMTVYEEVFVNGRYMAGGWNTAGYTLNVLESFPTRIAGYSRNLIGKKAGGNVFTEAQSFEIEIDGVSLDRGWDYVGFEKQEESVENTGARILHSKVILKNKYKPVKVIVHTILDGSPVLSRWLTVENLSDQPMNIGAVVPMCGGIETIDDWKEYLKGAPDCAKLYSLGYMDQAAWGHEGYFKWHDLPNISYGITGRHLSDRYRHPAFMLRNNVLGNMMFAQMGWSAGYRFDFQLDTDTTTAKLSFKMALDGVKPLLILEPGEVFKLPQVHIGMLHGDLDDAVNGMHMHLRRSVLTMSEARGRKGWVVGGMGPERLMDVAATKHFIDTLAAVGAETMNIDAGWYCPLGEEQMLWSTWKGDWHPDATRYPNGIKEVRDYAHEKGLLFGLWVELESLGRDCQNYKNHPDWMAKHYDGTAPGVLNMADPEIVAWAESELERVIEEYQIDLFRLDHNTGISAFLCSEEKNGIQENITMRYYQNVTAMYERLKRKFPNVVFENCAGGGGRTNVDFIKNFTHTWVSDCNVAPRSFTITNGMTMVLPPEYVDRLVSGMNCHTRASLDFQVRNTIFGRPSTNDYNALGSDMNPEQIALVKHTFDIYKEHIRPYIDNSKIYHHTPELVSGHNGAGGVVHQPQGTGILERASADGAHGVIGIFKLADSVDEDVIRVYPRGIDVSKQYKVTFDNCGQTVEVLGLALLNEGLSVRLKGSLISELIIYEVV